VVPGASGNKGMQPHLWAGLNLGDTTGGLSAGKFPVEKSLGCTGGNFLL